MNTAVTIMQAVDWSKYDLEGWLYQFGAWMRSASGVCGRSVNPIAVAMDEAVKKRKYKMKPEMQKQIIADYMSGDLVVPRPKGNKTVCEITDNEARAVQRLILDMQGQSDVLDGWLHSIIDRYFYGCSIANMVNHTRTLMETKFDLKCGLAALHCKYPFIVFKLEDISDDTADEGSSV
ncbi:hypothetical protein RFH42_16505 [Acinetobacter rudis]|uniref:hypothetical protein n=1 Tax=Acinetobacter rudis TaxID=632955 RepID=UPI00280F34E4|nr:hypothetical protein [Acinetobacter rudis]MDQ8954552.1 hypothetical protein [Acinetobacter rudis]